MWLYRLGFIHRLGVSFMGLIILNGSNNVLSKSCCCVNEYISFINGLGLCGKCGVIGERGVSKCISVGGLYSIV